MSSSTAINNYCEMFPKLDLTPILDTPTFETIHQQLLQDEVKANASFVHSNLG